MAGKHDLISYKKNINTTLGKRNDGMLLDYDEAEKMVVKYITDKRLADISNDKTKQAVKTFVERLLKQENMVLIAYWKTI